MIREHRTIELFPHNQAAYDAAEEYLLASGKAAIIHPTGTGKSYIAFKLCEEHSASRICWLAPSEYIFRTQLENVRRDFGFEPENITFYTYAGLMRLSEEQMAAVAPDYIILDEFHRCGAEMWGDGVRRLFSCFPDCPVLGLSATNIRYLDNRRDMADELFDGNIASRMTLGEAIVLGILQAPTYVTALFRYQKVYEQYENRVKAARSKKVRDQAEPILEKLKRMLENADGLDRIFEKHMKDRRGKYLVFCSGKEHMDAMQEHISEWFGRMDETPHVYIVYSGDPETSRAFQDFKADREDHLRLLFCIDMLNEGIHVEDVSGVILLRPTVSPVVYRQQIGRAMSAAGNRDAVIFDIVDNISGLVSIDYVKEEMEDILKIYRARGESERIVNEHFEVVDEVRECRQLFDELEQTLSATWDQMYEEARRYYRENGNLLPPLSYVTPEGYRLGQWLVVQRGAYHGRRRDQCLSEDQIRRLEAVGMCWDTYQERLWEEKYAQAFRLFQTTGQLCVEHGSANPEPGLRSLALWLKQQRYNYEENRLSPEKVRRLESIGMIWEREDTWMAGYKEAKRFYEANGHLNIPATYIAEESGYALGHWYRSVKAAKRSGTLSEERQRLLENIGMQWESVRERNWMSYYRLAEAYYRENGNLTVHLKYQTSDGVRLGVWISGQRDSYKKGRLTQEQITMLEKIGMSWQQFKAKWYACFDEALHQYEEYGTVNVPADYICENGFRLGAWIAAQRNKYRQDKLNRRQVEALEALEISWEPGRSFWEECCQAAEAYRSAHGDLMIPADYVTEDGIRLGAWLSNLRTRYKKDQLSGDQIRRLENIGMIWDINEARWNAGYERLREYRKTYGNARVPQAYACLDGYKLGSWVSTQRQTARTGRLDPHKLRSLEAIGFTVSP